MATKTRCLAISISSSNLTHYQVKVAISHPLSPLLNAINHRNIGARSGPCRMTELPSIILLLFMTPSILPPSQILDRATSKSPLALRQPTVSLPHRLLPQLLPDASPLRAL